MKFKNISSKMCEPIIKKLIEKERKIELLLLFPKNAIYFDGHFPETPILPGFVQVHYAMFFANKSWKICLDLKNIKKMKFSKIISPDTEVCLLLEKYEDSKITFRYKDENHLYSSGEFYYA